jgi:hypothetical protein
MGAKVLLGLKAVLGGVAIDIGIGERPAKEAGQEYDGQDSECEQTPEKHVPSSWQLQG